MIGAAIDRVLGLVPAWAWAAAVLALLAIAGAQRIQVQGLRADIAAAELAHRTALDNANARERDIERQWHAASQEVLDRGNAVREINAAAARAVDARAVREADAARAFAARVRAGGAVAGDGLRLEAGGGGAREGAAAPPGGSWEAAAATGRMYAELYGWAAERLAIVARYADDAAAAGLICQRLYEVTEEPR